MLQRLRRALPLIFLFASIIAAEDDISVEIEGLTNFFNPFNWFGEDVSALETPERNAPQPQPESVAQPNPAPNLASPSESIGGENVRDTNPESEVRIEGAPRDSIASLKPISTLEARQPDPNNIARPAAGPSNNAPSSFGQPGRTSSYGGPPYGVPIPPHHLRHPGNENSAHRSSYMPSPYGNAPPGNSPYGNAPQGISPYGNAPPGNSPYGKPPPGNLPYGNAPYGNAPPGNSPYGKPPPGNLPYGNSPYGNSPYGNSPYGSAPHGNSPYGGSPYNNPAYGASNPYGRNLNTRNAPPQDTNPSNNRAAPPDPSSYRSRSNRRRGNLTLKPKEQPPTA